MKYNIALTPIHRGADIIALSQQFSTIADRYCLGEHSLPHVTLYQFYTEENKLEHLWKKLCQTIKAPTITLEFKRFSCTTYNNNNELFWIALLPNQIDVLNRMHAAIASVIELPINKSFDPHMTLINTKNKAYETMVNTHSSSYHPLSDVFILSLGKCDGVGQFTTLVYQCNPIV